MSGESRAREAEAQAEHRPPLTGVAITLAGIAVLAALVLAIDPLRDGVGDAVSGDTGKLREDLRGLGFTGALIVLGLALAHAFVWYPAEILDAAVGFVYEFWIAFPLVMVAWVLNGVVAYWIGRHAARPLLYRFIERHRFEQLERMAERGGVSLLLAMRLIPIIPFSLFSYVAGAAHVPLVRFIWTTAVGYIPITAVFVYLGSQLEELSPTDPLLWAGAVVLIALVLLTHRLRGMLDRQERGDQASAEGAGR
ncbi:MAG TPA: VTT domain-containing protein [Solirubrobacterales bacterium]|nr:VTT domain-containing protein [Solirubrobacterales bacterium]